MLVIFKIIKEMVMVKKLGQINIMKDIGKMIKEI